MVKDVPKIENEMANETRGDALRELARGMVMKGRKDADALTADESWL